MNRLMTVLLLSCAALPAHADPGRLFYTPAQRAQLEQMRAKPAVQGRAAQPAHVPPVRFDGVVIRSDGRATRWVDGRAQVGATGPGGLKPGQIRADGKTYEPYQVLPSPTEDHAP